MMRSLIICAPTALHASNPQACDLGQQLVDLTASGSPRRTNALIWKRARFRGAFQFWGKLPNGAPVE